MEKILDIADSIAYEKNLSPKDVKDAIRIALIKSAQKVMGEHLEFEVDFDEASRKAKVFQKVLVIEDNDERLTQDQDSYIPLSEALAIDDEVEIGDELKYEIQLENFGRSAASTMYRELEFEIQKLVENELYKKYSAKAGKIVSGQVVRVDSGGNTFIEIDEIRAMMPLKNRIKGENFKVGDVVKAVLKMVNVNSKHGVSMELSRTSPKFLEELMRLEVPEVQEEIITIERCARIPGDRAKVALSSNSPRVDPIGTAVGVKGVRISAVSKELNKENIDVIEYSPIPEIFISRAMSPAIVKHVELKGEKAFVTVAAGQKSKAIGKSGVNIRLASMLTGIEIELIEEEGEAYEEQKPTSNKSEESNALAALFG